MSKVEWKIIPIFKGLYKINSNGDILSVRRNRLLKPSKNKKGYLYVDLRSNKKRKGMLVHRLVLLTFKGKSKLEVNHIDGNKENNKLENLEYVTCKENIRHAWSIGLCKATKGEKNHSSKLTERQVKKIKSLLEYGYTHKQLGLKFNVHSTTIGKISTNKNWKHIK